MKKFKSLFVEKKNSGKILLSLKKNHFDSISKDEIVIKVSYSSLNFKDVLLCTGNPGLIRKFPHIPGIDAAGKVFISNNKKFKVGDKVMVVARPIGVKTMGGFSEYLKVPFKWVEKIPNKLSEKQIMIFGTAGFTAAKTILSLKNLSRKKKPILISGASGGVGIFSIILLLNLGFNLTAITSRNKSKFLKKIGVSNLIFYDEFIKKSNLPLLKMKYSNMIDNTGGATITEGIKQLEKNGKIYLIGNSVNEFSEINILPFILRENKLIGVNAESTNFKLRKKIWKMLVSISNDKKIKLTYKLCKLNQIKEIITKFKSNSKLGRYIVKIN